MAIGYSGAGGPDTGVPRDPNQANNRPGVLCTRVALAAMPEDPRREERGSGGPNRVNEWWGLRGVERARMGSQKLEIDLEITGTTLIQQGMGVHS